ncbi:MAG: hypothetical protein JNL58_18995 [Planctomyces sp.]|nr:hypothetical protein [Planctomyces sp.]
MHILRRPPAIHHHTPYKIAVVTGLSDPESCRLTKSQRMLITPPDVDVQSVVRWNFPFTPDPSVRTGEEHLEQVDPAIPLLRASFANSFQFLRSLTFGYQTLASPHWESLLQSTSRLLLITGSCGLQLINSWTGLAAYADRIRVLALGPVAFSRTMVPTTILQGSRDTLSRLCFRSPEILVTGTGHMDYWEDPQVREIAAQWLRDRISESSAPVVSFPRGK